MGGQVNLGSDIIQLSYLQWLESQEGERQQKYTMFRNYYEGEHETQLTARMRKYLELTTGQDFSLNYCPIVVDSLAEKLNVTGVACEGQAETMWEWWRRMRADALQRIVHLAAVRDGDTYVLVEWDNAKQRPHFHPENAFDGVEGTHVIYSDERRMLPMVAIKRWVITSGPNIKTRRTNLYFPDRIEKYIDTSLSGLGAWQQYAEPDQPWPIPWTLNGQPLGIPVVHFRNKDQGYSYGESELEDVTPIQNGLNKTLIDLLAAADATGFRLYTMTGGIPTGITVAPGSWLYHGEPDARIGAIDGADLSGLIALKDSVAADIAKVTRTPLSYFQLSGQVAASETLKQQESGLISRALDRQVAFGNAWEDAFSLARRLHNAFGAGGLNEEEEISALWRDAETRNELEHLQALAIKREKLEIPRSVLWAEAGYDPTQIATMEEALQAEQSAGAPGADQAFMTALSGLKGALKTSAAATPGA